MNDICVALQILFEAKESKLVVDILPVCLNSQQNWSSLGNLLSDAFHSDRLLLTDLQTYMYTDCTTITINYHFVYIR